jgi:hypothetical protein
MNNPNSPRSDDVPRAEVSGTALPTVRWCPVPIPANLMPYEAAAKAIFIRANGGPAYYKTTGTHST